MHRLYRYRVFLRVIYSILTHQASVYLLTIFCLSEYLLLRAEWRWTDSRDYGSNSFTAVMLTSPHRPNTIFKYSIVLQIMVIQFHYYVYLCSKLLLKQNIHLSRIEYEININYPIKFQYTVLRINLSFVTRFVTPNRDSWYTFMHY